MSLKFMRHAQSVFNAYQNDAPDATLSAEGRAQAARVSGDYDVVIVSPLRRTSETLAASKITYRERLVWPCVREMITDVSDTLAHETLKKESWDDVRARAAEFRERIKAVQGHVLVITHHDFLMALKGESFANAELRQ